MKHRVRSGARFDPQLVRTLLVGAAASSVSSGGQKWPGFFEFFPGQNLGYFLLVGGFKHLDHLEWGVMMVNHG